MRFFRPMPTLFVHLCFLLGVACGFRYGSSSLHAQEVVEIDFLEERVVLEDSTRAMSHTRMAVDPVRGVLYVEDREEPRGVISFSLHTGEHLLTIAVPEGEGPNELPKSASGMVAIPGGGLFVADVGRVLEFDLLGRAVSHWQPRATVARTTVCVLGNEPAIPAMRGVIRRGTDGTDDFLGPEVLDVTAARSISRAEYGALVDRVWYSKMACDAEVAYVVSPNEVDKPDSVIAYGLDGASERRFAAPVGPEHPDKRCELTVTMNGRTQNLPCPAWHHQLTPSLDEAGNLILLGKDDAFAGVIMNPETQCYALLRPEPVDVRKRVMRIHKDSALVFEVIAEIDTTQTPARVSLDQYAFRVSMNALRRIEGEPCPGILPSVEAR